MKYLIILAALMLCGCSAKGDMAIRVVDEYGVYPLDGMERAYKTDWAAGGYEEAIPASVQTDFCARANDIESRLAAMPGIEKAVCLISGNTAIIGIRPTPNLCPDEIIALEKMAMERVNDFAPELTRVSLTAAAGLYERIANVKE